MEQDDMGQGDMGSEDPGDQGVASKPEQPNESHPSAELSPQSSPPALNDGLELPRSSDC